MRCSEIYDGIAPYVSNLKFEYEPIYLLYTLHFLYRYPVERVLAITMKTSRDTLRRVIWPTICAMAQLSEELVRSIVS